MKKSVSLFYKTFINESIDIITNGTISSPEGSTPMVMSGILADMDDEFLYLIDETGAVCQSVFRNQVIAVTLSSTEVEITETFEDNKDFN